MDILFLFIGLLIGLAVGFLIARNRVAALETRVQMLDEQHSQALAERDRSSSELLAAQEQRFNEAMARMTEQMKNATADMLRQRQQEFAASSSRDLGQIVTPLCETIDKMKQAINDNTLRQTSMTTEMKSTMEHMMRHSQAAKESADQLARVFKFGNKMQGDWGETVLEELLQTQGLTRGVHYDTQATLRDSHGNAVKGDEGERMRPDVILHLDQHREVIVDSKVSLSAFIDFVNEEDPAKRQQHLKAHVDSINRHVKELARKNYSAYVQPPKVKMDYVIMFVPHSGALWTALNHQPDLWRKAMEQNVFIADEQTLYAALRIIDLTWMQITQNQNHEKVYALADEMLNRVGQFWKQFEAIGKNLKQATASYDEASKKITDGGKSINTTARQLMELGARASDKNPLPQSHPNP